MRRFNVLLVVMGLASGIHTAAVVPGMAQAVGLESAEAFRQSVLSLEAMPAEERQNRLDLLGSAIVENPVALSDDLEASVGGRMVLRAYVQAMVEDRRLSDLAEQLFAVMHAKQTAGRFAEVLNRNERQDGSVWYPYAEQAGFFAGGIAAVLDGKSATRRESGASLPGKDTRQEATHLVARRFDLEPPVEEETAAEWMLEAFTGSRSEVSTPAAQWFEKGFLKAYR
ncbi:MAG: hypothetical protein ABS58_13315 [Mesorhizobium sp. SCN 65-20]|mgnify:CR=1 FL=1|nr:MAG: hypothetical protein ABS58_13315 [Mesorhizobium sp. SCN 65-20]